MNFFNIKTGSWIHILSYTTLIMLERTMYLATILLSLYLIVNIMQKYGQ